MIRLFLMLCLPMPALADMPPKGFFAGEYEVIGRMSGADGALFSDWVVIDQELVLHSCKLGEGQLMENQDDYEGSAPIIGQLGELTLACRYLVDGDNYPRLTCMIKPNEGDNVPGLMTLWHQHRVPTDQAKSCN